MNALHPNSAFVTNAEPEQRGPSGLTAAFLVALALPEAQSPGPAGATA